MPLKNMHGDREPDLRYDAVFTLDQLYSITDSALEDLDVDYAVEDPKQFEKYDTAVVKGDNDLVAAATINIEPGTGSSNRDTISMTMDMSDTFSHIPPEGQIWTHVYAEEMPDTRTATTFYTFSQNDNWEKGAGNRFANINVEEVLKAQEESKGSKGEGETEVGEFYSPEGCAWEDFGAHDELKDELISKIQLPLEYGEVYEGMDIEPDGIILYGPPGTGKTLVGRIAASEADSNFLHATGADIYGSLMGESEQNVQELFDVARENSPTLVFIDEIDQISQERGSSMNSSTDRVVNQMLTELDGMEDNTGVRVVGTTNRLDNVDPALMRKGRLSNQIEIPLPNYDGRRQILQIHTDPAGETGSGVPVEENIDYDRLAEETEGYSGADLAELVETAAERNVRNVHNRSQHVSLEDDWDDLVVTMEDLEETLEEL